MHLKKNGYTWLHYLGRIYVSYLLDTPFGQLDYGFTTECRLVMIFFTWYIVKLDYYVTLCSAFHILILANYIIHLGIKMVSWSWVVGDVPKTPEFSYHIQENCLFLPAKKSCSLKATRSSKSAFLITGGQMY